MAMRGDGSTAVVMDTKTIWIPNQDLPLPPPPPPPPHKPWIAWLVPSVAIVNIVFFAYTMYANDCPARHPPGDVCILFRYFGRFSFEPLSINPLIGPDLRTLDTLGALDYKKIVSGEPWRLISCIWLHAGIIHLLVNMLSLLFIGIRLEQEFGFGE
ncbi:hypothetical protein MA16_Dca006343 [Dendrobium catenatum]|uniref:RHOMBOID-like protein n=1 Tax=Dendrobium catenatum TaxID=906689 RepID=A0A2I0W9L1_9ASPA|nr:hypothetical protein MA16_Dca006343 [Dendrobium catenatum]